MVEFFSPRKILFSTKSTSTKIQQRKDSQEKTEFSLTSTVFNFDTDELQVVQTEINLPSQQQQPALSIRPLSSPSPTSVPLIPTPPPPPPPPPPPSSSSSIETKPKYTIFQQNFYPTDLSQKNNSLRKKTLKIPRVLSSNKYENEQQLKNRLGDIPHFLQMRSSILHELILLGAVVPEANRGDVTNYVVDMPKMSPDGCLEFWSVNPMFAQKEQTLREEEEEENQIDLEEMIPSPTDKRRNKTEGILELNFEKTNQDNLSHRHKDYSSEKYIVNLDNKTKATSTIPISITNTSNCTISSCTNSSPSLPSITTTASNTNEAAPSDSEPLLFRKTIQSLSRMERDRKQISVQFFDEGSASDAWSHVRFQSMYRMISSKNLAKHEESSSDSDHDDHDINDS